MTLLYFMKAQFSRLLSAGQGIDEANGNGNEILAFSMNVE